MQVIVVDYEQSKDCHKYKWNETSGYWHGFVYYTDDYLMRVKNRICGDRDIVKFGPIKEFIKKKM